MSVKNRDVLTLPTYAKVAAGIFAPKANKIKYVYRNVTQFNEDMCYYLATAAPQPKPTFPRHALGVLEMEFRDFVFRYEYRSVISKA